MNASNNPANYQPGDQVNYPDPKRYGRVKVGKVVSVSANGDVVVEPRKNAAYVYVPYAKVSRA